MRVIDHFVMYTTHYICRSGLHSFMLCFMYYMLTYIMPCTHFSCLQMRKSILLKRRICLLQVAKVSAFQWQETPTCSNIYIFSPSCARKFRLILQQNPFLLFRSPLFLIYFISLSCPSFLIYATSFYCNFQMLIAMLYCGGIQRCQITENRSNLITL